MTGTIRDAPLKRVVWSIIRDAMRFAGLFLAVAIMVESAAQQNLLAADQPPAQQDPAAQQLDTALGIWRERRDYFVGYAKGGTRQHDTCHYDLQAFLSPVLQMAAERGDLKLLDDLVEVAEASYADLRTFGSIRDAVKKGAASAGAGLLDESLSGAGRDVRTWFLETPGQGGRVTYDEVHLNNFQYLFFVCKLSHHLAAIPAEKRTERMKRFLDASASFITDDQLMRHIYRSKYSNWSELPEVTGYRELELKLKRERTRRDGKAGEPYFNAVLDRELWLIAATAEWLAAHGCDPAAVPLGDEQKAQLGEYVKLGCALLQSRLQETDLKNFKGEAVKGLGFDHGIWAQHPDRRHAGYEDSAFPGPEAKVPPAGGVGWDFSHAGRFPWVFVSLYDCRQYTGTPFPTDETLKGLANQFAYGVFNGDFRKPLFRNFMDGSNGWFRVNYEGRANFGYPPFGSSEAVLDGSWALWARVNPDVARIMDAVQQMLQAKDPEVRAHREKFYPATLEINRYAFFHRLQFASACAAMKR